MPRLRQVDFQPVIYEQQQMWLIRDPMELSEYQLILTPELAQMLILFDGSRDMEQLVVDFEKQFGFPPDQELIDNTISKIDQAYLLDNERSRNLIQLQLEEYRARGVRPASLAGMGYPAEPEELSKTLAAYEQDDNLDIKNPWMGRGIISPHIDYQRGGPVYSSVWRRAAAAVAEADLVLIFGTDHFGGAGSITLTQMPYATPYGLIPTEPSIIRALSDEIGPGLFDEELHHRKEHSIELSAVWLHYMRQENVCPTVPILCGSFHHFVTNGRHPADDPKLNKVIETLQAATTGKRVLAVASVDLAHVGPNFGDDFFMDSTRRESLASSDESLMEAIAHGDANRFYEEVAAIEDQNRICGFSAIYLMLNYLGETKGQPIAYKHCPADQQDTSLVSICGMLLD
jgi:AmmeMemoRadiSam system protein B